MNGSNETPTKPDAAPDEAAEAAAGLPEKRPWSKPEIWTSDGVLRTKSGNQPDRSLEYGVYLLQS